MPAEAQADQGIDPNGSGVAALRLYAGGQTRASPGENSPGHADAQRAADRGAGIAPGGEPNPQNRSTPRKLRPAVGIPANARSARAAAKRLLRIVVRGLGTVAERASDEPFDVEGFIDALGLEKLGDTLDPGHEQIAPGAGALATGFGSIFHSVRPAPHTHIQLRIEGRFRAAAEEFASRYAASDKQGLTPTAHLGAGLVFASLGRHVEALEAYGLAGGANPCGLALCFMAISLASLNRLEDARRACRESLRLMPDLVLAGIALRTYGQAMKYPGRRMRDPCPLVIFLSMGDEPTCGTCGRKADGLGHIGLDGAAMASFKLERSHRASVTLLRLCYVGGLCDIAEFRMIKLVTCAYSVLELCMLIFDPVSAAQLGAMRPLVEVVAANGIDGIRKALPAHMGRGKGRGKWPLERATHTAAVSTFKQGAHVTVVVKDGSAVQGMSAIEGGVHARPQ